MAVNWFSYVPAATGGGLIQDFPLAERQSNMDALAHAQAIICLIFWSLCGCVYAGLSITYPAERRRIATLGFALAAGGENNGEDIALLVGDDEEDEELQDVVPRI